MNAKRWSASLLIGVLLVACTAAPATLDPTTNTGATGTAGTPGTSPTATAASPTPVPLPSPTIVDAGLPAGWHHELACSEDAGGCQLHLRDAADGEQPGWPVSLSGQCWPWNLATDADGIAYIACRMDDERLVFNAVGVDGVFVPGWPIETTGYPTRVEVAPDGTPYFGTAAEEGDGVVTIHALGADGRPSAGWPITLPRTADFSLAPDGAVAAWWYEDLRPDTIDTQAARTKFTMIGPDGRTLPGRWPVTSIGTATSPVVTKDGSLFYTSETGKVWGHDRGGNVMDGWPYQLTYRVAPQLRPDGHLMFISQGFEHGDGTASDSEVIVLTGDGQVAPGWPYRTSASLEGVECAMDTPPYYPQAVDADATLYLAPWTEDGAAVVALDAGGRMVEGWPHRLPVGSRVTAIATGVAGQIVVTLSDCAGQDGCCASGAVRQITLTSAGVLAP